MTIEDLGGLYNVDRAPQSRAVQAGSFSGDAPNADLHISSQRTVEIHRDLRLHRGENLSDGELLAYALCESGRRDYDEARKDATHCLAEFGSLGATVAAPYRRLLETLHHHVPGFQEAVARPEEDIPSSPADGLLLQQALLTRILNENIKGRPLIGSWTALIDYLSVKYQHEPSESFHALFLDRKNILIKDERQSRGTVDHTPLYPREVLKRALELGASAIILVHNHPSGDPTPSQADIDMTSQVSRVCETVGIKVHDHVIIGKNRHTSFRAHGHLQEGSAECTRNGLSSPAFDEPSSLGSMLNEIRAGIDAKLPRTLRQLEPVYSLCGEVGRHPSASFPARKFADAIEAIDDTLLRARGKATAELLRLRGTVEQLGNFAGYVGSLHALTAGAKGVHCRRIMVERAANQNENVDTRTEPLLRGR